MAVWNAMFCDIVLPPCANQASPLISNLPYCRDIAFSLATSRPFPPLGRHGGGAGILGGLRSCGAFDSICFPRLRKTPRGALPPMFATTRNPFSFPSISVIS